MVQVRAKFTYTIHESPLIVIIDDKGHPHTEALTVTNDIEAVVRYICDHTNTPDLTKALWVYRDSDSKWDGYDPDSGNFYSLNPDSAVEDQAWADDPGYIHHIINSSAIQSRLNNQH